MICDGIKSKSIRSLGFIRLGKRETTPRSSVKILLRYLGLRSLQSDLVVGRKSGGKLGGYQLQLSVESAELAK